MTHDPIDLTGARTRADQVAEYLSAGYSQQETAEALGITRTHVSVSLQRIKAMCGPQARTERPAPCTRCGTAITDVYRTLCPACEAAH